MTRQDYIESYEDMLDECYEDIRFGCCSYSPSQVLKAVDPIAYEMGLDEYIESIEEDMEDEEDDE